MAKNIFQLAKIARRIPRRLRGIRQALLKLDKCEARTEHVEELSKFLVDRYRALERAQQFLPIELAVRNVTGFTRRCSLPRKQQRQLGLLPKVS